MKAGWYGYNLNPSIPITKFKGAKSNFANHCHTKDSSYTQKNYFPAEFVKS